MRALFLLPLCAVALAGCDSLTRYNGDNFEVGAGGIQAFEDDAQACGQIAGNTVDYDVRLAAGSTRYARNRAFNRVYGRCMTGRGHPPRPYIVNLLPARS